MQILEVSQVNKYIREVFSSDIILSSLWVKGEISNFKYHSSGHMYFTLKDQTSILRCVMFRMQCTGLKFLPADGMKVIIRGHVSVFERDGQYQLYCEEMTPDGLGALYLAFEQLKAKLEREGIFSASHKKPLPLYPQRIGVITSPTGAVIRDIINVSTRRFPNIQIVLYPAAVQGESAAGEVAHALRRFNELANVDVIIVARGGGSLEELWAFNQEEVARAIYASDIPVVSAVGHETDYTIADMVADLRAPTPSAAAELVVPDVKELKWKISQLVGKMSMIVEKRLLNVKTRLEKLQNSLPFKQPFDKIYQLRMMLELYDKNMRKSITASVQSSKEKLSGTIARLNALSPLAVLSRGYCLAEDEDSKKIVNSVEQIRTDRDLKLRFSDGSVQCTVKNIIPIATTANTHNELSGATLLDNDF